MSVMFVHELITELEQEMTVTKTQDVRAIRPSLLRHGSPGGNIKMEVRDSNDELIAASNTVDVTSMSTEAYFHGQIRFDINCPLRNGRTVKVVMVPGGGYTFDANNFVAWKIDQTNELYTNTIGGTNLPLWVEMWEERGLIKGLE